MNYFVTLQAIWSRGVAKGLSSPEDCRDAYAGLSAAVCCAAV